MSYMSVSSATQRTANAKNIVLNRGVTDRFCLYGEIQNGTKHTAQFNFTLHAMSVVGGTLACLKIDLFYVFFRINLIKKAEGTIRR